MGTNEKQEQEREEWRIKESQAVMDMILAAKEIFEANREHEERAAGANENRRGSVRWNDMWQLTATVEQGGR